MPGKKQNQHQNLSRRERQIMDILFRLGAATASEVRAGIPDAPSYSAVRAQLATLERKGHARHESRDLRYLYMPTIRPEQARRNALRHLVDTFFGGSSSRVIAALLDSESARLDPKELTRLSELVEQARKEGK
jgi:predicted transcriptional regulator